MRFAPVASKSPSNLRETAPKIADSLHRAIRRSHLKSLLKLHLKYPVNRLVINALMHSLRVSSERWLERTGKAVQRVRKGSLGLPYTGFLRVNMSIWYYYVICSKQKKSKIYGKQYAIFVSIVRETFELIGRFI